jgi:hypothetical protein
MAGLDPAIHVFATEREASAFQGVGIPASSAGMTAVVHMIILYGSG